MKNRNKMQENLYNNLLLFSLFGVALWFFGNLYEGIVIAPNLLTDSFQKAQHWQNFIDVTNPILFYVPLTPLSTITLLLLYFKTPKQKTDLKRQMKFAVIFQVLSYSLSIYIITQINLIIFFGDLNKYIGIVHTKALLWNILNIIRVTLVAIALIFNFKAYLQTQK
jgi:hypothetical protein